MDREALAVAVTQILLKRLPETAGEEAVAAVVADLVTLFESEGLNRPEGEEARHVVITSLGRNRTGVVHGFSEVLAENDVDIVDVNQTLVHGNFAMMMIVDPSGSRASFTELKEALKKRGDELGVQVYVQYEDMMRAVNRV